MTAESTVAILVDCENAQPAVLDRAMQLARAMGRVTVRRGYGNSAALVSNWQEALVRHGFSPCMQFQFASKKNTADIALALDALEMLLDRRAERFLIVTSDSDFVYLCRKLQERGAVVHLLGESKTPLALQNACERFHEFLPSSPPSQMTAPAVAVPAVARKEAPCLVKRRPRFVVEVVRALSQGSSDGMADLGALGNQLRKAFPGFSHGAHGYKSLRSMLEAYDLLRVSQSPEGHCRVGLAVGDAPPTILHAA